MDDSGILSFLMFPLTAAGVAAAGLAARVLGWRVLHRMIDEPLGRLMDTLAAGTFGFVVFMLALTLTSVRENFVETEAGVATEALELRQLERAMETDPADRRAALVASYARAVVDHDWPALGRSRPALAPESTQALAQLRVTCAGDELAAVGRIEHLREERLRRARAGAPPLFWAVTTVVLLVAAFMRGTTPATRGQLVVLGLYLAAFGLVIALTHEFERPFWGWVSVSSEPIARLAEIAGK